MAITPEVFFEKTNDFIDKVEEYVNKTDDLINSIIEFTDFSKRKETKAEKKEKEKTKKEEKNTKDFYSRKDNIPLSEVKGEIEKTNAILLKMIEKSNKDTSTSMPGFGMGGLSKMLGAGNLLKGGLIGGLLAGLGPLLALGAAAAGGAWVSSKKDIAEMLASFGMDPDEAERTEIEIGKMVNDVTEKTAETANTVMNFLDGQFEQVRNITEAGVDFITNIRDKISKPIKDIEQIIDLELQAKKMIKEREGFSQKIYEDRTASGKTAGYSVGYGHFLGKQLPEGTSVGQGMPRGKLENWLSKDIQNAIQGAKSFEGFEDLNQQGQLALIDLVYQRGIGAMRKTKGLETAIKAKNIEAIVNALKETPWFKGGSPQDRIDKVFKMLQSNENQSQMQTFEGSLLASKRGESWSPLEDKFYETLNQNLELSLRQNEKLEFAMSSSELSNELEDVSNELKILNKLEEQRLSNPFYYDVKQTNNNIETALEKFNATMIEFKGLMKDSWNKNKTQVQLKTSTSD